MASISNSEKVWPFATDELPPYPSLPAQVANPEQPSHSEQEDFQIDTGFNGSIALSDELLGSLTLEPIGRVPIRTATGYTETLIYRVLLTQVDLGIVNRGITAISTIRSLLGRRLLEPHKWLLDFQNKQLILFSKTHNNT